MAGGPDMFESGVQVYEIADQDRSKKAELVDRYRGGASPCHLGGNRSPCNVRLVQQPTAKDVAVEIGIRGRGHDPNGQPPVPGIRVFVEVAILHA
jgi:hypothetical protein